MTTFSPGLSDSIASVLDEPRPCPHCDSSSQIAGGLCVGCLLGAGLNAGDEDEAETLSDVLAEVRLPDQNWRLGNYEVLEEIGRGGMGVIYRARQRHSRRIVAVKRVLSYHADSRETLARFRREAQAAASLDHPNILPIYEVSESEDGLPFFSMKFAPGGTLQQVAPALRKEPRQCVALVAKITRAVQYAHSRGILHRDLKPGNILLDARGEPLVSDFGLAKWLDTASDLTRTLTIFGTPGYIAPEQASAAAAELKPTADVYSLGAILFDLLAGRPPFLGTHALSVIRQAAEFPAPKLRSLSKLADRDLETICSRCLERDPNARYPSAHDLAEDLERWLEGRPIIARRISPPLRVWRWSKRSPKLAASISGCLILGAAALTWQTQSRQLSATVREDQLAAHSVAVLPFLDLDDLTADYSTASSVAGTLQNGMARIGLARVIAAKTVSSRWTGAATQDEIQEIAHDTTSVAVLTGTRRQVAGGLRISLHLFNASGGDALGNWTIEARSFDKSVIFTHDLASAIYGLIHSKKTRQTFPPDPVIANERARGLFVTGQDLLRRKTIPDMDRAITCLEGAIREEPRTIIARSALAMAYMGRDLLSTSPALAQRALDIGREAIQLAPKDPTGYRSLSAIYAIRGMYSEALETGSQALELGERSERAFGQIGFMWRMAGRPDKAIKWYQKAKVSQRQPADYDALLGDCWVDLGKDATAEDNYRFAISLRPDQPDGWIGLCRLKLINQDWAEARRICQEHSPAHSGSPFAKEAAGLVAFFSRDYNEALKIFTDLALNDPFGGGRGGAYGAIDYRSAIARLKMEAGDTVAARALLIACIDSEQAKLSLAPNDAEARYRLAAAEAVIGETTAALRDMRAAVDAGWIDHRSTRLDPRFDNVRANPEFEAIITDLAKHVIDLGYQATQ